jgi:hypothetical protein
MGIVFETPEGQRQDQDAHYKSLLKYNDEAIMAGLRQQSLLKFITERIHSRYGRQLKEAHEKHLKRIADARSKIPHRYE